MIRVNLVPIAKSTRGAGISFETASGPGAGIEGMDESEVKKKAYINLLVVLLPILAMYSYQEVTLPELSSQIRSKTNYLSELKATNSKAQGAVDEIEKFRKDKDRLQLRIDTLEGLSSERLKEVKVLDAIQKDIPERVWLTKVNLVGDQMTLMGFSTADIETTNFMDSLSKSVHLKEVRLIKSFEQQSEGSVFKVFEIGLLIDRTRIRPSGGRNE